MTEDAAARIYVDADACPVRDEAVRVADRRGFKAVLVSNGGIRPSAHPTAEVIVAPPGPDAADIWIADRIGPGDICVTNDIPLATRCVEAGAVAIRPNGDVLNEKNAGEALAMRNLMADLRAANPLGPGGGAKPFSKSERSRFLDALDRLARSARPR